MTSPTKTVKNSPAFTLLELVIVVLILGTIYSMVSLGLHKSLKTLTRLDSSNLRDFMRHESSGEQRTFYLYGDKCQYYAFKPQLPEAVTIDAISFSPEIKAWWFDRFGRLKEQKFAPLKVGYENFRVCLAFTLYPNQSSSPLIIEDRGRYFYAPYFEAVQSFDSQEAAETALLKEAINPRDLGVTP